MALGEMGKNINDINESGASTLPTLFSILDTNKGDDGRRNLIINDSDFEIIKLVIFIIICGIISLAGLVANIVNLIVFFRQGALSDSSTLCLLSLAVADIGCLVPVFCNSAFEAISLANPVGNYVIHGDYIEILAAWLHIMFVQIAGWITTYITMERCVCVVFPFKAKSLFTAKRSLVAMVIITAVFTVSFIPTFTSQKLEIMQDSATNRTSIHFIITEEYMEITLISDYINSMFLRTLVLMLVFVFNQITVFRVKLSKSWRKSFQTTSSSTKNVVSHNETYSTSQTEDYSATDTTAGSDTNATHTSPTQTTTTTLPHATKKDKTSSDVSLQRERRLIRMVTTISTIFLVCNIPDILAVYLLYFEPSFRSISSMDNLFATLLSLAFFLESFNSSINILVYYRMSTRYRRSLRQWLRLDKAV